MNDLLFGNGNYPPKIYLGGTLVTRIMHGLQKVWPRVVNPCDLEVGDTYQGGIIAYYFTSSDPGWVSGECHGIIAQESDISTGIQWYNGDYVSTGATDYGIGYGNSNTNTIVSVQGSGSYAAKICADSSLNDYTDWFLPSLGELQKLYDNRSIIGGFTTDIYWSSTESGSEFAQKLNFNTGLSLGEVKSIERRVRAVRYF